MIEKLKKIARENSIRGYIAREAIENHDDPEVFLNDLIHHGCSSCLIKDLVYYEDTHAFFDEFYDEIEDLRYEYESNMGTPITIGDNDLKNFMAWFAVEETASLMANELEIN